MNKVKKKVILGGIVAIVTAAVAVINVNLNSRQGKELSFIALENIEALSSGETNVPTYDCPGGNAYCVRVNGVDYCKP
ncbi:MAG: NVEALA domain-containing protein [Prevotellaceae bacterium]|jgi:hypothetical protein|nr:NVEALA domain-containing protein [Prevotellaceae bacterium]